MQPTARDGDSSSCSDCPGAEADEDEVDGSLVTGCSLNKSLVSLLADSSHSKTSPQEMVDAVMLAASLSVEVTNMETDIRSLKGGGDRIFIETSLS